MTVDENDTAGKPSLLKRFGVEVSAQPKRTLLGDFTFVLLTITSSLSIKFAAIAKIFPIYDKKSQSSSNLKDSNRLSISLTILQTSSRTNLDLLTLY